jgi:hypothetical protein
MGLLDDALKGWGGLAVGAGTVLVAPRIVPVVSPVLRAFAKMVVRTALAVSDGVRGLVDELGEQVEDLVAEVRAERTGKSRRPARHRPPVEGLDG